MFQISKGVFAPVLAVLLLAIACSSQKPQPTQPSTRVESPGMGIALATVPRGFEVAENEGDVLRLDRTSGDRGGTLTIQADPVQQSGVNLVDAVNEQKTHIESLPDGKYLGNVELMGPTGTAFSTRGRYMDNGQEMEEVRLLTVHPSQNRLLSIIYRYPAGGDTKERIEQAMEVLGEIGPLTPPGGEGQSPAPTGQAGGSSR